MHRFWFLGRKQNLCAISQIEFFKVPINRILQGTLMSHEIEVKFRVEDFAAVRKALRARNARNVATVVQTDTYFDRPDGSLRAGDCGLRLRELRYLRSAATVADRETRPQLTFKGPAGEHERVKVRREIQTHVDDGGAMRQVLEGLGLSVSLSVQKKRSTWRLDGCTIELDELPLIGRYVEIEGRDDEHVHRAATHLGLDGEPITDHYLDLLTRACPRAGRTCHQIHLDRCPPGGDACAHGERSEGA
jgi:adenylate cyclase class 2